MLNEKYKDENSLNDFDLRIYLKQKLKELKTDEEREDLMLGLLDHTMVSSIKTGMKINDPYRIKNIFPLLAIILMGQFLIIFLFLILYSQV